MNVELAVDICRGEGALLTTKDAQLKPIVDQYKKLVEKAGNEAVTLGKITRETLMS